MYQGNVCDVHIHVEHMPDLDVMAPRFARDGLRRYVLQGAGSYGIAHRGISNALGLLQKLRDPEHCYAFANLDHPDQGVASAESLLAQVKRYWELGFDGIKMIEGKPSVRRRTGVKLDDPRFDPMFDYMEEHDIPLLSHVNDPRYFWDVTKMTPKQIANGWGVGPDGSPFEEVRAEALTTMRRHPKLRTVFAHFFFASANVAEADAILDAYPNVKFDLTPGTHYNDMAADYEGWRDFFIRRADRILYGTDNCVLLNDNYNAHCRRILETNETMDHYGTMVTGFALPDAVLEKIYETNFIAFAGASPRKADKAMLSAFVDWNKELIADSKDVDKLRAELDAVTQRI